MNNINGKNILDFKFNGFHTSDFASRRLVKRHRREKSFKYIGLGAITLAAMFLIFLLYTIVMQALPAFTVNYLTMQLDGNKIIGNTSSQITGAIRNNLTGRFSQFTSRKKKRQVYDLITDSPGYLLKREFNDSGIIPQAAANKINVLLSDDADLYIKGITPVSQRGKIASLTISAIDDQQLIVNSSDFTSLITIITTATAKGKNKVNNNTTISAMDLTDKNLSLIIIGDNFALRINKIDRASASADLLFGNPRQGKINTVNYTLIKSASNDRRLTDLQIALLDYFAHQGKIVNTFNWQFFTSSSSAEPELTGIKGAVIGSFWTMLFTLIISLPFGVAAAIYLLEFAKQNKWARFIEININNLAAVPSIVFGLLGLAIFINFFGMPRSAPVTGGAVLALMTLPTIIIASRAAITSVPPSIRDAALGVGASKMQMIFHHVLPLALPGILTGTIIGMAQALGETAPLLMIGMVAFVADVAYSPLQATSVLPVEVFLSYSYPEVAFKNKAAATIVVLLVFLITMNALAIILRKRFEKKW